jgi:hypothetical protein
MVIRKWKIFILTTGFLLAKKRNMPILLLVLCMIGIPGISFSATANLICSQDFENVQWTQAGIGSEFTGWSTWNSSIVLTDNDPHSGNKSVRWNQDSRRIDPITGKQGIGNSLFDYRGPNNAIQANTPNEMYFSYWYRHDDYNNSFTNGARKMFYLVDDIHGIKAMYIRAQNGTEPIQLVYGNGGYSFDWAYAHWGYSGVTLGNTNVPVALDGKWNKFEFYINYSQKYVQIWINGHLMKPTSHPEKDGDGFEISSGKIYYDQQLHFKGIQFYYYDATRDQSNASDRSGYASAIQIDDIEVWDAKPGIAPKPPTNLTVTN